MQTSENSLCSVIKFAFGNHSCHYTGVERLEVRRYAPSLKRSIVRKLLAGRDHFPFLLTGPFVAFFGLTLLVVLVVNHA